MYWLDKKSGGKKQDLKDEKKSTEIINEEYNRFWASEFMQTEHDHTCKKNAWGISLSYTKLHVHFYLKWKTSSNTSYTSKLSLCAMDR